MEKTMNDQEKLEANQPLRRYYPTILDDEMFVVDPDADGAALALETLDIALEAIASGPESAFDTVWEIFYRADEVGDDEDDDRADVAYYFVRTVLDCAIVGGATLVRNRQRYEAELTAKLDAVEGGAA
jgi:hypothetical protein